MYPTCAGTLHCILRRLGCSLAPRLPIQHRSHARAGTLHCILLHLGCTPLPPRLMEESRPSHVESSRQTDPWSPPLDPWSPLP